MHEEQSRLVGDLTVAFNLPRTHALLAGANTPEPIRPMPQRQFGILVDRTRANRILFTTCPAAPEKAFIPPASAAGHLVNVGALAMGAYGRMAPALPFKELNRSLFIPTGFGQVLNDVRFRKLRMFLTIHGSIFHDEVGHLRGNPLRKIHNLRYLYTPVLFREYIDNAN